MKPGLPLILRQQHLPKMAPHSCSMVGVSAMDTVHLQISTGKSRSYLDAEFMELMDQCLLDTKLCEACSAGQPHTGDCAFTHTSRIPHLTVSPGPLKSSEAWEDPCSPPKGLAKHI